MVAKCASAAATLLLLACMQQSPAAADDDTMVSASLTPDAVLLAAVEGGQDFPARRAPIQSSDIVPDAICGKDTRKPSTKANVCKMFFKTKSGSTYVCSAWVVTGNKLATAGHCVVDNQAPNGFIASAYFTCGGAGNKGPYYTATDVIVYNSYLNAPDDVYKTDAAVVKIAQTFPTRIVRQKFGDLNKGALCSGGVAKVTVNGYPAVSNAPCNFNGIQQWGSVGGLKCDTTYKGFHRVNVDSCGGGSGSRMLDANGKAISIFVAEVTSTSGGACVTNLGTRILDGGNGKQGVDGIYLQPLITRVGKQIVLGK